MRIAIAGTGAVGSVIAAYLMANGKHEISLLARGAALDAIRRNGLIVDSRGKHLQSRPAVSDDPAALGAQDVIIVTVKGYGVPALAPTLAPMRKPGTLIITAQNGIPWWYLYGLNAKEGGQHFESVDPGGIAWTSLGPENALGCVVSIPSEKIEPGVVHHDGALRLVIGAPRPGEHQLALREIAAACTDAGIEAPIAPDIRLAIWSKMQSLVASGPLSVLSGANHAELDAAPGVADLRKSITRECFAIAHAWDVPLDPKAIRPTGTVGAHKASMLQDFEAGRRIELDAILTAVLDLARFRDVPVPMIEAVWSLTRLRSQTSLAMAVP